MGHRLADLTWLEAERLLTPGRLVLLPLGAAAKEHGPHLRLDTDRVLAEALAERVAVQSDVVVAPTLTYHYYPAFIEYPGSTTLRLETARDLTVDVVTSLAEHGPQRFYVLNTGLSTVEPLRAAAAVLRDANVLLHFTDFSKVLAPLAKALAQQQRGSHADEVETSMLLHLAPERVNLAKAVRDDHPKAAGGLVRDASRPGTFSPTGTWGDPTLATPEKGRRFVDAVVEGVLADLAALQAAPLPRG